MIIIHDGNWQRFAESVREEAPYLCGNFPRQGKCGDLPYARPYTEVMDLIPPSKYDEYYQAMVGRFIRQKYESCNPKLQNQGPHPACTRYSLAQHMECVRANMGLPYIQYAPESVSGTYGWSDAGSMCKHAIAWVKAHGIAPRSFVPQYSFNPKSFAVGWEQAALDCVALEVFDLGTKDIEAEVMTALLTGEAVHFGVDWLMHAMNYEEIQKQKNGEYGFWTPNTWGAGRDMLLLGSKKIPDEAYVVRQVTFSR